MSTQLSFLNEEPAPEPVKACRFFHPKEYKIQALRDCPVAAPLAVCDTPDKVDAYWRAHVSNDRYHNPDVECFVALLLNTRRRIIGHHLVAIGTLDTLLAHPREVFRAAIIGAAAAVILAHNHPSGDPTPSEADIKVTRDMVRAGQLLKVEVLDHVIIGQRFPERPQGYVSLRELGFFS